jgi:hypothetical protein
MNVMLRSPFSKNSPRICPRFFGSHVDVHGFDGVALGGHLCGHDTGLTAQEIGIGDCLLVEEIVLFLEIDLAKDRDPSIDAALSLSHRSYSRSVFQTAEGDALAAAATPAAVLQNVDAIVAQNEKAGIQELGVRSCSVSHSNHVVAIEPGYLQFFGCVLVEAHYVVNSIKRIEGDTVLLGCSSDRAFVKRSESGLFVKQFDVVVTREREDIGILSRGSHIGLVYISVDNRVVIINCV